MEEKGQQMDQGQILSIYALEGTEIEKYETVVWHGCRFGVSGFFFSYTAFVDISSFCSPVFKIAFRTLVPAGTNATRNMLQWRNWFFGELRTPQTRLKVKGFIGLLSKNNGIHK